MSKNLVDALRLLKQLTEEEKAQVTAFIKDKSAFQTLKQLPTKEEKESFYLQWEEQHNKK